MVSTLGKAEEFDSVKEEWSQYTERLDHFFEANSITMSDKKRAVFLSVVGPATYKILRNLISPVKPKEKSYEDIVAILTKHYEPVPSEIVDRCKFHSRFRKPGESVATFVAELRSLAEFCNFGEVLEDMLRDRLVCGIRDEAIQKRLLAESKLTYQTAVELAQSQERTAQNVKELKGKHDPDVVASKEVHKVGPTSPTIKTGLTCYRCGKVGHVASKCRVSKDLVCRQCGKSGHLQKACRSGQKWTGVS